MIPFRMNPMGIEKIPLTLTAQQAGSTVTLNATESPTVSGLHYRRGKSGLWLPYTIGTTVTLDEVGDSVQFWNSADTLSNGNSSYVKFVLSGLIAASGNLMSLLNYADAVPSYGFRKLFSEASALTSSPELTAKTIGSYGCAGMFEKCTGLLSPIPEITALTIAENCFDSMYAQCSAMLTASALKSPVMAQYCCQLMYYQCISLASVYVLNATLATYCFRRMFYGCSSLALINTDMTSWTSTGTYEWVSGVADDGTFIKPTALTGESGVNRIPSGWTVIDK